jgi:hypothetical protein
MIILVGLGFLSMIEYDEENKGTSTGGQCLKV